MVVLVDDQELKRLKKTFWGKNSVSDVVSMADPDLSSIEIIINVDQAERQSPWGLREEIIFLYIHGILHILGHEDNTPKRRSQMLRLGQDILGKVVTLDSDAGTR